MYLRSLIKMGILLKVLKDLLCLRGQVERDSTQSRSVLWREECFKRAEAATFKLRFM